MAEIYGHRWVSAYGASPLATWAQGLAGKTPQQLAIAIGRCLSDKLAWPPTLPEFIELTRPTAESLGLPSEDEAYREAVELAIKRRSLAPVTPSHNAIWHAACECGLDTLRMLPEDKGRARFTGYWKAAVDMVIAGRPLTAIPAALPPPPPRSPEQQADLLAYADRKLAEAGIKTRTTQ